MLFSSLTFLYVFLPVTLLVYFLVPQRRFGLGPRNWVLLIASLIFYAWGGPGYLAIMVAQITLAWGFGLAIERWRSTRAAKPIFIVSICLSLVALLFYKYTGFFLANLGSLLGVPLPLLRLVLPLGISFYTFQILSYLIDLYRGTIPVQRNIGTFATYVALFPQLIAGPIVRYAEIRVALTERVSTLDDFAAGARRFSVGLAKKILIANTMGGLVELLRTDQHPSTLSAWLYLIAFALQIYFDFSAYSDMAVGLGRMFGLKFPENFNYPYISRSITEFWRRWHMTLSAWFRDYVYFSLGGSRVRTFRVIINLLIVWCLTGFWHGAAWNFLFWGGYYAVLLIVEKYLLKPVLEKLPRWLTHVYALF
ncbi:MAG: MBOAT family protein, partial [Propionibacteriaceae bacterium]|nr:MBOAT family protein [Propionibacteriaceae bacterium]